MRVSFLQGASAGSTSVGSTQTITINNTAGSCMVLYVSIQNATTLSSVSDSKGNSYANNLYLNTSSGSVNISVYYVKNCIGGNNTITLTPGSTGWYMTSMVQEFFGVDRVSPLDTNNRANISSYSNPQNGAAVTTTNSNDLIVAGFIEATTSTLSLGSGYSNLTTNSVSSNNIMVMESQRVDTVGTYTPTIGATTTGFGGDTMAVVLKAGAGPIRGNYGSQTTGLRPHAFSPGLAR